MNKPGIVSRETQNLLEQFVAEVLRWQKAINLIAPKTIPDIWQRHVADCSQLVELIPRFGAETPVLDLGSGGGFPAMVLACYGCGPVRMIESDRRKCQFLAQTARKLGLDQVEVIPNRIEAYRGVKAGVITARALAPLPKLLGWALPLSAPDGTLILMKGANWQQELAQAKAVYDFDCQAKPSRTDAEARILILKNVSKKET